MVDTDSGKPGKPGKLREKNSLWKTQGKLREKWSYSGKMKFCFQHGRITKNCFK